MMIMKSLQTWILLLGIIAGVRGCFRSSSKPEITTTTTTTTPKPEQKAVEENILASNVGQSQAARGSSSGRNSVTTTKLKKMSEEMFKLDQNSIGSQVSYNLQKQTTSKATTDDAPKPLLTSIPLSTLRTEPTFGKFMDLLNNYDPNVARVEHDTKAELQEQEAFLDAVMATPIMLKLQDLLKQNHLITGNTLRSALKTIWFTPYSRKKGRLGSSGFEHVFAGEIKDGGVSGFHNYLFMYLEEKEGDINYMGWLKKIDLGQKGIVLKMRFNWMDYQKKFGSMFIGTSPELEMALYTLCFYTRPNKGCSLRLNNNNVRLKVYVQPYKGKKLVGSAYPDIY